MTEPFAVHWVAVLLANSRSSCNSLPHSCHLCTPSAPPVHTCAAKSHSAPVRPSSFSHHHVTFPLCKTSLAHTALTGWACPSSSSIPEPGFRSHSQGHGQPPRCQVPRLSWFSCWTQRCLTSGFPDYACAVIPSPAVVAASSSPQFLLIAPHRTLGPQAPSSLCLHSKTR
jgi:hypothetical protein